MAQLSNKLSHYLSSRALDREAEGLRFDFLPRKQISLYSKLVTNKQRLSIFDDRGRDISSFFIYKSPVC